MIGQSKPATTVKWIDFRFDQFSNPHFSGRCGAITYNLQHEDRGSRWVVGEDLAYCNPTVCWEDSPCAISLPSFCIEEVGNYRRHVQNDRAIKYINHKIERGHSSALDKASSESMNCASRRKRI